MSGLIRRYCGRQLKSAATKEGVYDTARAAPLGGRPAFAPAIDTADNSIDMIDIFHIDGYDTNFR